MINLRISITTCITVLIFLAISPSTLVGQNPTPKDKIETNDKENKPRLAGYFTIGGVAINNNAALNKRLEKYDYPEFNDLMWSFGAGVYGLVTKRIMLGAELHGHVAGQGSFEGRNVSLDSGSGFLNIGYLFDISHPICAYPMLGIGVGLLKMDIGSEPMDDFDEVLENPDRQVTLAQMGGLINLGAGLEYKLGEKGAFTGFRAGYKMSVGNSQWKSNGFSLQGAPDASLEGPYLHLMIGWFIW